MRVTLISLACLLASLLASGAHAAPDRGRGHSAAISLSPIHAFLPMVELQAEFCLTPSFSVAVIGGVGQITTTSGTEEQSFSVFEGGAQGRFYFYGTTEEGAFAGLEALWVQVSAEADNVSGVGNGLAVGPLVGYKWVWDNFFIDLAGGVAYGLVSAEATDGEDTQTASDSDVIPIVNFNLGWAF